VFVGGRGGGGIIFTISPQRTTQVRPPKGKVDQSYAATKNG